MNSKRTLLFAASAAILGTLVPLTASAQEFATPPPGRGYNVVSRSSSSSYDDDYGSFIAPRSVFRLSVGPAGRAYSEGIDPGLLVAVDLGRGPAGFRLTGAWLDVGTDHGLSQYTGELTIDFGGGSRFRPVVGAGAGVGRTSSSANPDGTLNTDSGAWLGLGIVRAGIGFVLPFDEADARVGLDLTGSFPAIRASNAPPLSPWLLGAVSVSIGF